MQILFQFSLANFECKATEIISKSKQTNKTMSKPINKLYLIKRNRKNPLLEN